MIAAICIGRGGSKGFPGKNLYRVGKDRRSMLAYPVLAAIDCKEVNETFFSTEDKDIKSVAAGYGAKVIDRPKELATDGALSEDVFVHAYNYIKRWNAATHHIIDRIEFIVLMFANAPCVTSDMLSEMIGMLKTYTEADSICTVSKYNAFSPYRARKILPVGILYPFVHEIMHRTTSDRSSGDDSWIYDCSAAVVRPECLENVDNGMPPQKFLGRVILPYKQEIPALDVDHPWEIGQIEYWLERNGKAS